MIMRNNKGFTLLELLIAMTIATVVMAISLQMFESGMKIKNKQVDKRDVEDNLRLAMDYIRNDITEAGAFMGDQGYFNHYSAATNIAKQFCVDFSNTNWPDSGNLQAAWSAKFTGWYMDPSDDMIEIWYADGETYSTIKSTPSTNKIQSLVNIDIEDDPQAIGFRDGDYVLFYDSSRDDAVAALRGSQSLTSWLTVLTDTTSYSGENVRGTLLFDQALPYTDPYQTPSGFSLCSYLSGKSEFSSPDRVYMVHRVVYGLITKNVSGPGGTQTFKMLVRDDFRDPTGASRFNPQIVSTDMEHLIFTSIFKLPKDEATVNPDNYYNSLRLNYHYNYSYRMFSMTIQDAITADAPNATITDCDPRDLRAVIVEMSGVSRKKDLEFVKDPGNAPKNLFAPEMGVVEYSTGGKDVRIAGATSPDFYVHRKMTSQVGLRTVRMKDFAVNPN